MPLPLTLDFRVLENGGSLEQFAAANGLQHTPSREAVLHDHDPFTRYSATALDLLRAGTEVEIGNLAYWSVYSDDGQKHGRIEFGFVGVRLAKAVPHIEVRNKRAKRRMLPFSFGTVGETTVSLEGDFDDHFALLVPRGYENDALYLFTPDVMALAIDQIGDLSAELIDDWVFFYAPNPFALHDSAELRRLFTLVNGLGEKLVSRSANYRDERAVPTGRRRARSPRVFVTVAIAVLVGLTLVSWFSSCSTSFSFTVR